MQHMQQVYQPELPAAPVGSPQRSQPAPLAKPPFVPPTLTCHGTVATITQDAGGSFEPDSIDLLTLP